MFCRQNGSESTRKRRKKINLEDSEAHYEKEPRTLQDDMEEQHELLPIKSKKGFIQRMIDKPGMYTKAERELGKGRRGVAQVPNILKMG